MALLYVTAANMLAAYDARTIGDLVNDNAVKATSDELLAPHPNLLFAMENAEAEAHSKLIQGGRYTTAQLTGLTGHPLNLLRDIVCKLTMLRLFDRRPSYKSDAREKIAHDCQKALDRIRKGEDVLDLTPDDTSDDATMPVMVKDTPQSVLAQNLIVDECTGRFYPGRMFQDPYNR
jgi:hypothetical protein